MLRHRSSFQAAVIVASVAWLAGCAETQLASTAIKQVASNPAQATPHGVYKIGDPYQIAGVWYYPAENYNYDETGVASWYGPDFHGKYTANGEVFDQNDVTAAHRTLPLPSLVRVTNLENGRTLEVRVNDRGPFAHGRIIDLSRRAAQLLGIEQAGTAKVRVQVLGEESRQLKVALLNSLDATAPPQVAAAPRTSVQAESLPPPGSKEKPKPVIALSSPPPAPSPAPTAATPQLATQQVQVVPVKPTNLYVQAGAFSVFDNAHRLGARLSTVGPVAVTQVQTKAGHLFRVRLGPFANLQDADSLLERLIASGIPEARIVAD